MKKFNTFNGVFIPSYEAILGAVLFLILPFLAAGMGFSRMVLIVLIANSATIATSFSIADCTTNLLKIGSGGMFAVSKRSLGKAFGGSIGIQLFLAQALSIGFYVIGFAESLQGVFVNIPQLANFFEQLGIGREQQIQFIAVSVGIFALIIALAGADFVVKIQMIIFVILSISVIAILLSPVLFKDSSLFTGKLNVGGTGLTIGFWGAFAMFFPAVTGIDAGVGMSGQLKDPRRSLSKGTFLAIGVTLLIYLLLTFVFALMDSSQLILPGESPVSAVQLFQGQAVMQLVILLGILFATGSSTLSYLVTAPRTAQALAQDRLLPKAFSFLKYDFRKGGKEPRWATLFTFVLFIPIIIAGSIQVASLVVGVSFLTVYGWVNLAAFLERVSGNPSFRPTSKGHWLISLYGFFICMTGIVLFNPLIGVLVLLFQFSIFFLLLRYRSGNKLEGVWWGVLFKMIQWTFSRIGTIIQGTKNWRPIMRVFAYADKPAVLSSTLEMAQQISHYKGLTMVNIFSLNEKEDEELEEKALESTAPSKTKKRKRRRKRASKYEKQTIYTTPDEVEPGILSISQSALPGGFQTNTVLLPMDTRLNLLRIIESIIKQKKHVLLYREGKKRAATPSDSPHSDSPRIDLWWKGESNGNLMALLAYIITQSETEKWKGVAPSELRIRFIRKLNNDEKKEDAQKELEELMYSARLDGDVEVLDADDEDFYETVKKNSSDAVLVMQGMPGEQAQGLQKLFALNELFFSRNFEVYKGMPAMLFIKASHTISLEE